MQRPIPAPLSSPVYYLENFLSAVHWIQQQHSTLLKPPEAERLDALLQLPQDAQALLVRILMRKGDLFRTRKLKYDEISSIPKAIDRLISDGWLHEAPLLNLSDYFSLFTKAEIQQQQREILNRSDLQSSVTKQEMLRQLLAADDTTQLVTPETVIQLNNTQLFRRLQLLFFGNLHQDWSEFVLTEMGVLRYEKVNIPKGASAFGDPESVDRYIQLIELEEEILSLEGTEQVLGKLPLAPEANPLLERLRSRILFRVGQQAQRAERYSLALECYGHSHCEDARLRGYRLKERVRPDLALYQSLIQALELPLHRSEREGYLRILKRLAKKLNQPPPQIAAAPKITAFEMLLQQEVPANIELYTAQVLATEEAPTFYVENGLFNGLFALLFWPALYAAIPGAFFHPFQSTPADLNQKEFVSRRQEIISRCFAELDGEEYRKTILERWQQKQGISCRLIDWGLLDASLIRLALECISAADLHAIFSRMLENIADNCKGFPDLIQFYPGQQRYRLIEVKGPGDKLQEHQRYWLEYLQQHQVEVSVCYLKRSA